jgi:hypothetical protein
MNNEQQHIIDEAYENYLDITDRKWMNSDIGDLDDMIYDRYLFIDGDDIRVLKIEEFIYIIKEVAEFAEKWGLKIEERELTWDESNEYYNNHQSLKVPYLGLKVPTKLITITYNDKTIESYE